MRWARIAMVAAACLGVGGVLGACTSGPASPPKPTRLSPPIPGNPLDFSKSVTRPCALLRPDQLAQYHLGAQGTMTSISGVPACAWSPASAGLAAYQAGVDMRSGGIEALYHRRSAMPVFQPATVSEYPAVHTAVTATALRQGRCTVDVGVADDTLLVVDVTVPSQALDYGTPCDDADAFAADAIANAQGAQP